MKGNFKKTTALTLLNSSAIKAPGNGDVEKWQECVAGQMDEITRSERMTPRRAVVVGLMLHAVKASLKHGDFTPWLRQTLTRLKFGTLGTAQVKASYYMRLSLAFVEDTKPSAPELAAIPAGGMVLDLDSAAGSAAKLVKRIDSFCGESSLNELLVEHGIKHAGTGGANSTKNAALPADDNTLLQELAAWRLNLRRSLVDPTTAKRIPPEVHRNLYRELHSDLQDYAQLLATMGIKL